MFEPVQFLESLRPKVLEVLALFCGLVNMPVGCIGGSLSPVATKFRDDLANLADRLVSFAINSRTCDCTQYIPEVYEVDDNSST